MKKVVNTITQDEKNLDFDRVRSVRFWKNGLMITDLNGEVFNLSNKEYDTDIIFKGVVVDHNFLYVDNSKRFINLDFVKNVKTEIAPASDTYAVKVLFEGDGVEVFNCSSEKETMDLKKHILKEKEKQTTQDAGLTQ